MTYRSEDEAKALEAAEFDKLFGQILAPKRQPYLSSAIRTITDLARVYLEANLADSDHAMHWQIPEHASTVCNPIARAITAIVGEEISERFWNHCEIETMVSDYIDEYMLSMPCEAEICQMELTRF